MLETLISDPRDISGSNITLDSDGYISGETFQDIVFNLYVTTSDTENVDFFSLTFPSGFTLNSGSESDGEYPTIDGNTISWGENNITDPQANSFQGSFNSLQYSDGEHILNVKVIDFIGNEAVESWTFFINQSAKLIGK